MGHWTSPPTRRELSLLLFCAALFILASNLDAALAQLGLARSPLRAPIGPDGRRTAADALEDALVGAWDWAPGRVAGVGAAEEARVVAGAGAGRGKGWGNGGGKVREDRYVKGEGRTGVGALWLQGVGEGRYASADAALGTTSVNEEFVRWGADVPRTAVVAHVPGYTVLDNVLFAGGTLFVVSDDPDGVPLPEALASSRVDHTQPPRDIDWQILPGWNASSRLGEYGGRIHGITFMSYDDPTATDALTLLTLQRLHSTTNNTTPPHRLLLPAIPTFSTPAPDPNLPNPPPRPRSSIGIHPWTLKTAYPSLAGALFAEDFDDFIGLNAPVLLDRVVVADRGASLRAGAAEPWARPFEALSAPAGAAWFDDVRAALARVLLPEGEGAAAAKAVTYFAAQHGAVDGGAGGGRLRDADHTALVAALRGLRREGVTVHVVDAQTPWAERMRAVLRSSVTLGAHGAQLGDAVFMRRGAPAALMEFFPEGAFRRDWAVVLGSMGVRYVAWQGAQKFAAPELPRAVPPSGALDIAIDVPAVVRAIREELARR